jgi:pyruvate dehydrogenase E1 component beta subunit
MDAIYNLAAKNTYFSGGNCHVPMVLMTATGGGYNDAGQHSQVLHGTFAHLPGLRVVAPSNAYDAKGLMISAIRDNSPVLFMFHKGLQGLAWMASPEAAATEVPEEAYAVPFGEAKIVRTGKDVTIVTISMMVHRALAAADALAKNGIEAEVIDLRTLVPLDRKTVFASVAKTGRLLVVDEDYRSFGLSAEIIASVVENDPSALKAKPRRIAYPDIPIPYSRPMEQFALPNAKKIEEAVREMMTENVKRAA